MYIICNYSKQLSIVTWNFCQHPQIIIQFSKSIYTCSNCLLRKKSFNILHTLYLYVCMHAYSLKILNSASSPLNLINAYFYVLNFIRNKKGFFLYENQLKCERAGGSRKWVKLTQSEFFFNLWECTHFKSLKYSIFLNY